MYDAYMLCRETEIKLWFQCQEKRLALIIKLTVPQTNTGGRVEHTQTNEITKLKELGNIAPVTSG